LSAVRYAAHARRSGPAATIVLTLLVALAGAITMSSAAGARRTASAFPRYLDATNEADLGLSSEVEPDALADIDLSALPQVAKAGRVVGFGVFSSAEDGSPNFDSAYFATAPVDRVAYRQIGRPNVLDGRLPDPDRADEVLLGEHSTAEVGDRITAFLFRFDELSAKFQELEIEGREPTQEDIDEVLEAVPLRVVGIGRFSFQIAATAGAISDTPMILTPAFAAAHPGRHSYAMAGVNLVDPDQSGALQAAVRSAKPDAGVRFTSREAMESTVQTAVAPYATTLRLFALVLALTSLVVLGQAVARQAALDASSGPVLRALGASRAQVGGVALARIAVIAGAGAALAVAGAIAASSRFPIGPARAAETDPGIRADPLVLCGGAVAIVASVVAAGGLGFLGSSRRRRSAVARTPRVDLGWLPPPIAAGVRAGLAPSTGGGPSRLATVVGLVAACGTVTAALGFGAGLDRLIDHPPRYGWTWDALLDTYESGIPDEMLASVDDDPDIAAYSVGSRGTVTVNGRPVFTVGVDNVRGDVRPQVIEGVYPAASDEVALGHSVLHDLGRHVGDEVTATTATGTTARLRIVGEVLVPALNSDGNEGVAAGAAMTGDGLGRVAGQRPSFILLTLPDGDRAARLDALTERYADRGEILIDLQPADIRSISGVRDVPLLLAGALALLGAGVLAHAMITAVLARRRELAVLNVLGFLRRDLALSVIAHATAVVAVALALGAVAGMVLERTVWRAFVERVGVGGPAVTPWTSLGVLALVSLVFANLIAAGPARRARRVVASTLATE
jgi:hypothetical protein